MCIRDRLTTGLWHFSRGLAFAATTRFGSAEGELSNLRKAMKPFARAKTAEGKISRTMLKVAERVLVGEMAARREQYEADVYKRQMQDGESERGRNGVVQHGHRGVGG